MKVALLLDKMGALLRRDLLTAIRYRTGFLMTGTGGLIQLAAFYYLSRAIGPGFRPGNVDYFSFVLVGTGFYAFLVMGINSFLRVVQEAQETGTLEIMMTTATPAPVLVLLSAVSAFAGNALQLIFYMGAGWLLLGAPFAHPNLGGCGLVLVLSLIIAVAIGTLAAALQLAFQKGSAMLWVFSSGAWFMTGTLFPTGILPSPLRLLSHLIPITHAIDAMRLALLQGASFSLLSGEIGILGIFCLILLPSSLVVFSRTLRYARQNGTLSFY
jgi:ABC-2 type transport system permease protein